MYAVSMVLLYLVRARNSSDADIAKVPHTSSSARIDVGRPRAHLRLLGCPYEKQRMFKKDGGAGHIVVRLPRNTDRLWAEPAGRSADNHTGSISVPNGAARLRGSNHSCQPPTCRGP